MTSAASGIDSEVLSNERGSHLSQRAELQLNRPTLNLPGVT